jgi:hypothetical protein
MPTPSAYWARRSSTNTTWPSCCAGRASASTPSASWPPSPVRVATAVSRETLRRDWGTRDCRCGDRAGRDRLKYAGYIDKQNDEVERAAHFEHLRCPRSGLRQVTALSFEVRQKLGRHRPATLGQAARLSGMTPAAVSLLLVHLKKGRFRGFDAGPVPTARCRRLIGPPRRRPRRLLALPGLSDAASRPPAGLPGPAAALERHLQPDSRA